MKILVTGANGMLGQDLCPILEDYGHEVIEADIKDFDITEFEKAKTFVEKYNPDCVIHCAAYTNVDKAEEDIENARLVNIQGTENLAKLSEDRIFVYISTDYVFDGTKNTPYTPQDVPNPINNYGKTKLEGENAVKKFCRKYYIIRTSWLYGHHGNNFVETMLSMANKPQIKVVDDQIGCPTWTIDLSQGIVNTLNKPFGIYHICGSGCTSWYGFAKEILKNSKNLSPCKTEDFPRPAKRPKYSVMDNNGVCRTWQAALNEYMELRF